MKKAFFVSLLFVIGMQSVSAEVSCTLVTTALETATKIRGLSKSREIPCKVHSKEEVRKFLMTTVQEENKTGMLEREAYLLRLIGLIPEGYNYIEGLVALYTQNIAGYYDHHKGEYVLADWIPASMQLPITVHEVTHALQDQHFPLRTFTEDSTFTLDEELARSALIEGDASAVMFDYQFQVAGQVTLRDLPSVDTLLLSMVLSAATPLEDEAASLKYLMIFPYSSGLRFVHDLLKRGGYSEIDKAFAHPPQGTREILHPEKYTGVTTSSRSHCSKGEGVIFTNSYGEFLVSLLLQKGGIDKEESANAAAGLSSDCISVYSDRTEWNSIWESKAEAKEFLEAFTHSTLGLKASSVLNIKQEGTTVIIKFLQPYLKS